MRKKCIITLDGFRLHDNCTNRIRVQATENVKSTHTHTYFHQRCITASQLIHSDDTIDLRFRKRCKNKQTENKNGQKIIATAFPRRQEDKPNDRKCHWNTQTAHKYMYFFFK